MRSSRAAPLFFALLSISSRVHAQEALAPAAEPAEKPKEQVCSESYQNAQITRREGKSALLAAREAARVCLSSSCQAWMTADCSQWLSELDARIPSLVFSAKNTADRDLSEVSVTTAEGKPIAAQLDGHAVEYEPGPHTFVFVDKEGGKREKQVIVREGAKAQVVSVLFDASPEELAALERNKPLQPQPLPPPPERGPNVLRYLGFGAIGLGAVGLGLGTGFGISALVRKGNLGCVDDVCASSPDPGRRAADLSTVSFIAGGVLAASGVALLLLPQSPARVTAQPSLGPSHAGLQLGGRF